jgi:MFS family permease
MDGVFGLAALILFLAQNYNSILAGRFIAGCASGISLVAAVSYLTELASAEHHHSHRGALVSSVEASVSLGFLVSYLASYGMAISWNFEDGWRLLFGTGTGLLSLIQFIGMRKMPESPEWLAEKGFHDKAHAALRRITPRGLDSDSSLAGRLAEAEAEVRGRSEQQVPLEYGEVNFFLLDDCPSIKHYWRQALIVAFLAIAEEACGHINIINYAPVIFAEVFYNYNEEEAAKNGGVIASELLNTTVILGVVKFVITTFVLFEVDKLGRRFLLKVGAGTVTVSLLFLALAFSVKLEDVKSEFGSEEVEHSHSNYQAALAVIGCTGVVSGFALSYGPITWLVVAELSPSSIRGRILGFYTVLTHGMAALISYTFLSGQALHGESFPFWLYFIFSLISFFFILVAIPETGGVAGSDVDDVESLLDETWFWSSDNPLSILCRPFLACPAGCNKRQNRSREELGRIDSCFEDAEGAFGESHRHFSLNDTDLV